LGTTKGQLTYFSEFQDMMCRIAVFEHFDHEAVILMRLQWYGVNPINGTQKSPQWHSGGIEKAFIRKN